MVACDPDTHTRAGSQIVAVSLAVRRYVVEKTDVKAIRFITSSLLPPPKRAVLAYLGIPLETGTNPEPAVSITRKAEVDVSSLCFRFWIALIAWTPYQFVDAVHGYVCCNCDRFRNLMACREYSHSYNVILALKEDWTVESIDKLPEGVQPQISVEELLLCEDIIRADERVIKLAKEVGELCFAYMSLCTG